MTDSDFKDEQFRLEDPISTGVLRECLDGKGLWVSASARWDLPLPKHTQGYHGGVLNIVWQMSDDAQDNKVSEECELLAKRIIFRLNTHQHMVDALEKISSSPKGTKRSALKSMAEAALKTLGQQNPRE